MIAIGRYALRRGETVPAHRHTFWEVVYYSQGRVHVPTGEVELEAVAGSVLVTPPGMPHAEHALSDHAGIYLALDLPADPAWPLACADTPRRAMSRILEDLLDEQATGDLALVGPLLAQFDVLLRRAATAPADRSASSSLVTRAEILIERHLGDGLSEDGLSVDGLCRRLGVAASTLRAAFHRERGTSPARRIAALRLQRALALLATSTLTLESVARTTGYSSGPHLSRAVKEGTGRTPGAIRRGATPGSPR